MDIVFRDRVLGPLLGQVLPPWLRDHGEGLAVPREEPGSWDTYFPTYTNLCPSQTFTQHVPFLGRCISSTTYPGLNAALVLVLPFLSLEFPICKMEIIDLNLDVCTPMFAGALFTMAKRWKTTKVSTDG